LAHCVAFVDIYTRVSIFTRSWRHFLYNILLIIVIYSKRKKQKIFAFPLKPKKRGDKASNFGYSL
jgi:hypothetical protein